MFTLPKSRRLVALSALALPLLVSLAPVTVASAQAVPQTGNQPIAYCTSDPTNTQLFGNGVIDNDDEGGLLFNNKPEYSSAPIAYNVFAPPIPGCQRTSTNAPNPPIG